MTPTAALYQFWSSFGITAYPSNRVPEDTAFPFITYDPIICDSVVYGGAALENGRFVVI